MRCEGNHAPLKGVAANPWLWLLRGDDNGLKMNRFHEELGANPRRSWLNSRNGKISDLVWSEEGFDGTYPFLVVIHWKAFHGRHRLFRLVLHIVRDDGKAFVGIRNAG